MDDVFDDVNVENRIKIEIHDLIYYERFSSLIFFEKKQE